ncbi:MAG: ethanolamine utilization protein EutN [Planctomycetota bacterium]|nr:MAG: ethanolamine utilization protein EutN [Planctomycetota bacterium]
MKLARVVGTVVTPVQHPAYEGRRLLAVRPIQPDGSESGERMFVAVDRAQAGLGDTVLLMAEGSSVRAVLSNEHAPIRCAVVGVVDQIAVGDEILFDGSEPL